MKKPAERRSKIIQLIDDIGQVNVTALSNKFEVSEVTIRNDLDQLAKSNRLVRTHGGAFKTNNLALAVSEKKSINLLSKRLIGKKAASMIKENDSIILDSGTTTFEISNYMEKFEKTKIITNGVDIVNNLSRFRNLEIYTPGGYLNKFTMSFTGPMAERNFKQLSCKKLFLGVDGIKAEIGFFTHEFEDAQLKQIMIQVAEEVIVVADSSKFNKIGVAFIAGFDKIHKIITDKGIEEESLKMLTRNEIEVIIAD